MLKIEQKKPTFTGHNIRLNDDEYTMPEVATERVGLGTPDYTNERLAHVKSVLEHHFPRNKETKRIADLGCFEGGMSVEIARMGFETLGLEARQCNIDACKYVKSKVKLSNLSFVRDVAINLPKYGEFDGIVCNGLLYHLDEPKKFLQTIAPLVRTVLIIDTHFALDEDIQTKFNLSKLATNEGLAGRWFEEFLPETDYSRREEMRASSWDNHKSFWILKSELVKTLYQIGFDAVEEKTHRESLLRSTFTASKSHKPLQSRV
jgi:SAM-dependent methyltransferase